MTTKPTRGSLSYAVLGLLSLRPMSPYELVQGYGRSAGQVMPRSEAAIYAEPRRLEAAGLVTHADEARGRRVVPVYSITDAGRAELDAWLSDPNGFPQLEAEPVLRVVFADPLDPSPLRATINEFREGSLARLAVVRAMVAEYEQGSGPYQHRAPLVAMSGRFLVDLFATYLHWCDWALGAIESWPSEPETAEAWAAEVFAGMARHIDRVTGSTQRAPTNQSASGTQPPARRSGPVQ